MPRARVLNPEAPLIQGVASPNYVVDPASFYAATRRMRFPGVPASSADLGSTPTAPLRQTGIISALEIRAWGNITFSGTITGTSMSYEWPFNLLQNVKLSANGQSNLVSCRGLTLRALEMTTNPKLDDSGLSQQFGASVAGSGTLAQPTDDWGTSGSNKLGPGSTVAAAGTYTYDISWLVPVAADPTSLIGSVFAQSSATNLTLEVQFATQSQLLTLGGSASLDAFTINWSATIVSYSIPNVNGSYVVPDLSMFHQIAEARSGGLTAGPNEEILPGTGVGRRLMRVFHNAYSNGAPIALNATNYNGPLGWAFGGSDTPESYPTGQDARVAGYRVAGVDLGGRWGIVLHDFASQFALRDLVDEGTTSDLRVFYTLASAPTSGYVQVAQETLFAAPVGA